MLFNSFTYLSFILIVIPLYYLLPSKLKNSFLLLTSFLFYAYWDWRFCSLLIITTLTVYLCGKFIYASKEQSRKKIFLYLSLIINLGILVLFKYYNFFIDSFSTAFSVFGGNLDWLHLKLILPIGISFYTFQALTYVIDIYRGDSEPSDSIIDVSLFVTFFPQLLMGPIERARNILPQLKTERRFNRTLFKEGFVLITIGMFKKVIIGDTAGKVVNQVFADPAYYTSIELIMGIVLFTIQLYADFSGYTNIARGTAKMLGLNIMENFEQPYFSQSITEFWRRWHVSLSSWFRDYVYIPLGGSRVGKAKAVRNTFIIFLISGFWHGASWNFIAWGAIHAMGFMPLLLLKRNRKHVSDVVAADGWFPNVKELFSIMSTFLFATFAWIFFRAKTLSIACDYVVCMTHDLLKSPPMKLFLFLYVIPFVIIDWSLRRNERVISMPKNKILRYAIYVVSIYLIVYHFSDNSSFIYFQF